MKYIYLLDGVFSELPLTNKDFHGQKGSLSYSFSVCDFSWAQAVQKVEGHNKYFKPQKWTWFEFKFKYA